MWSNYRRSSVVIVLAYGCMCAIWGTTWLAIKISLHYVPPLTGVGLRFIIASLILFLISGLARRWPSCRQLPWRLILVLAVCLFGVNYVLTYVAETHLDSGLVAVLFGTEPFFVFAFAHVLVGERTNARVRAGSVVAFAGIWLIFGSQEIRGSPLYALAAIASAIICAFAVAYAKKHSYHDPLVTLPPAMMLAGVGTFSIGVLIDRGAAVQNILAPASMASLLYLALFGSVVAYLLYLWLLHRIEAWRIGLSALVIPVVAICVGIVVGGERPTWPELFGAGIVVVGMTIALAQRQSRTSAIVGEGEAVA